MSEPVLPVGGDEGEGEAVAPVRPRHSRRVVLAGLAAGGAALAGAGAAVILRGTGGGKPAAPSPEPTPPPTPSPIPPTPTPLPSPTPHPGVSLIKPAPDAFEQRTFARNEPIDWFHGIFFMDTKTGSIEAWRLTPAVAGSEPQVRYSTGGAGRWVSGLIEQGPGSNAFLFDRHRGAGYGWPAELLRFMGASGVHTVFEQTLPDAGLFVEGNARYDLTDNALQPVGSFGLPRSYYGRDPVFAPGGNAAAIWSMPRDKVPSLHVIELPSGDTRQVFAPPPEIDRLVPHAASLEETRGGDGLLATVAYTAPSGPRGPLFEAPTHLMRVRLSWDGATVSQRYGVWRTEDESPDGSRRAYQVFLRKVPPQGIEGGGESSPAVAVEDADGRPLVRIRSAALEYGDSLPETRWLADGSGFVALVAGEPSASPWDRVTYVIISPGGDRIDPLPMPVNLANRRFQSNRSRGPVPSPRDPDLISFGRVELYNRRSGNWFRANMLDPMGPGHLSPWAAGPSEMAFNWPEFGHDGRGADTLLPPKVELPPFSDAMQFRVARAGDCLNLRAAPSMSAEILDCLPEGALLDLAESPDPAFRPGQRASQFNEQGNWVYVRTPGAKEGWVSSQYLDWA